MGDHAANEIIRQARIIAAQDQIIKQKNDLIDRYEELLEKCRAQFSSYAVQHEAKGTEEGNRKAEVNQRFADEILVALTEEIKS